MWSSAAPTSSKAAPYYESVDLVDAFHPQTIVAHRLNGAALPVKNGAPLRMRIERQLGYKQAKYVSAIEAVASLERHRRRQGRLLGGSRLSMVCRYLIHAIDKAAFSPLGRRDEERK